ncbi:MAG TPA: NAD(P)/FAD-dependent oxidoreductase [Solirubrobacterales bacterium]|nr:NAD(P)/FAD-dependent oxidoreductase [Solirubrobacterales bacterium]
MPIRATKRGDERTPLSGEHDVLICGASFAGLAIARELAGSGADVLIVDRYEIGERQTSACGIPTGWLEQLGLMASERQRFDTLVMHTPHGTSRYKLPWTFSTFDYRELCQLLWRDCDATFETAKVNGRATAAAGGAVRDGKIAVETDRGVISAPLVVDALGWRRMLATGDGYQPPDAPLSRGLEVHPAGTSEDLAIWIDRKYVPAGYGWSFPARDELRIGIGSFDPRFHVKDTTVALTHDLGKEPNEYQGNWIPHKLRTATEGGVFFAGDSAGHCLPLSAEGIRTALYFGIALGRELRSVVEGRQTREQAAETYAAFHDTHEWKFRWMLRVQKLIPRIPPRILAPAIRLMATKRFVDWSFNHYLQIAPPDYAGTGRLSGSAHDQHGAGQQQDDADDALRAERDLVQAEQA